ncbi:MAG TPA: response regulator transcription factor [Chitinophagaceae bacterium]|nr:response regulator transcription factor [Chitinophagaceae bacterium]
MKKITILITDDHALLRETWELVLGCHPDFDVLGTCSSGEEAVETAKNLRPDVVLMDINLPGMSGIETTQQIRKYSPGSRVLGVSQHTQPAYCRKIISAGASGYVTKNSSKEEMCKAIIEVAKGNRYVCSEIVKIISDRASNQDGSKSGGLESLSGREMEIIGYLRKGLASKEIASVLSVAVKTVEVHRYNILKKLNIKNTASLVNLIDNEYPDLGHPHHP